MSAADGNKAVEAAALVLARLCGTESLGDNDLSDRWRNDARAVLTAAIPILVPAIEAELRARIADDIEAVDPIEWALAGQDAGREAARIARGGAA